jgi:hypothetical protein
MNMCACFSTFVFPQTVQTSCYCVQSVCTSFSFGQHNEYSWNLVLMVVTEDL